MRLCILAPGASLAHAKPPQGAFLIAINRAVILFPDADVWALQDLPLWGAVRSFKGSSYVSTPSAFQRAFLRGFLNVSDRLLIPLPEHTPGSGNNWTAPKVVKAVAEHEPWKDATIALYGFDMAGLQYADGGHWMDGSIGSAKRTKTRINGQLEARAEERWKEERALLAPLVDGERIFFA
jgi:hypothetical protein